MPRAPSIHVVDDDEAFQTAITRLLRAAGYEVRTYKNAGDFLLAKLEPGPGCILLDLRMPGPSGLELQKALATRPDPLPIIFLSGHAAIPDSVRAIKGGAVDFLTKPVEREVLLNAVRNALCRAEENRVVQEQLRIWRANYQTLTQREVDIFDRVVAGKMNKEIAADLGAAERTIKAHRSLVMQKMRAASLAELVHIADQLRAFPEKTTQSS